MIERIAADLLVILHFGFIVFVGLGGFLCLRWKRVAWLQVPAAAWGAAIELRRGVCPLTPLEQRLRVAVGDAGYSGGFIEHYLIPIIYPSGLLSEDALVRMRAADAMQALADLASRHPPLRPSVMLHLQELTAIGTPAMKARGRMLLAAMAGKSRRRSRSGAA